MTGSHALGKRWVLVPLCLCFLGCSGSSGLFPDKEIAWTRLDVEVAGPRIASAMVWDPVRHAFVLHAGQDVDWNLRPETWEWSPNSEAWRLIVDQSQQNPGPRMSHAMVWDPTRERMILFGGTDLDRYFDDTWTFDGSTSQWVRLDTIGNPPPRSQHGMVYDPDTEQVIVFGGRGTNHEPLHDTWLLSLDSLEWIQQASPEGAPHPQARDHVQMARDSISGIIVMRGCSLGDGIANETWTLLDVKGEQPEGPMDHGQAASNGQHLFLLGGFGGDDLPIDAGLTPRGATWKL